MWQWPRRARGLFGLGVSGGVIGALLATAFGVLEISLLGWSSQWSWLPVYSFIGFVLGAVGGVGFGALLAVSSSRLTLSDLGWKRAAILGGVAGALFPTMGAILITDGQPPIESGLAFALVSGLVGAGAGVSLLRIAQGGAEAPTVEEQGARDSLPGQ